MPKQNYKCERIIEDLACVPVKRELQKAHEPSDWDAGLTPVNREPESKGIEKEMSQTSALKKTNKQMNRIHAI